MNDLDHYGEEAPIQPAKEYFSLLGFRFTPTVDFGHVLQIVAMLGAVIMLWRGMELRLVILETKQEQEQKLNDQREADNKAAIQRLADTLRTVSENNARITALVERNLQSK